MLEEYSSQYNKLLFLLFVTLLSGLVSCKHPYTKVMARTKHGDPGIVYYYPDKDDTLNYTVKVFYPDGKLQKEAVVKNGLYVGRKVVYFHSGNIYQIDSLAIPCSKERYTCDGALLRYNENGTISQRFTVVDGTFNGLSEHYNSNGILVKRYYLKNDSIKEGEYFEYYEDGRVSRIAMFHNDSLVGTEYYFRKNGDSLKYYGHLKGQMDFPYKVWLDNGDVLYGVRAKGEFVLWTRYNIDGKLLNSKMTLPAKNGYAIPY